MEVTRCRQGFDSLISEQSDSSKVLGKQNYCNEVIRIDSGARCENGSTAREGGEFLKYVVSSTSSNPTLASLLETGTPDYCGKEN